MAVLTNIGDTYEGYQQLISLYEANREKAFGKIDVGMHRWFDANMCAPLGAIADLLTENLNTVRFFPIDDNVRGVLLKNDFLSYHGEHRAWDTNGTTVRYQKLRPADGKYFMRYVAEELLEGHAAELPLMSPGARRKMAEAVHEIFANAQMHSQARSIHTCGQFFPKKNRLAFTIADTGIGFRESVNQRFGSRLSADKAISWAVRNSSTIKMDVSGGLGLTVLREFLEKNKGSMKIVSNDGFYEYTNGREGTAGFAGEFPGAVVSLQFRTDDPDSYVLNSEIDLNSIL